MYAQVACIMVQIEFILLRIRYTIMILKCDTYDLTIQFSITHLIIFLHDIDFSPSPYPGFNSFGLSSWINMFR